MRPLRLHFTAGEASGDLLGREVIDAIRQMQPDTEFAGIGGAAMAGADIQSPFDISPLSVLGFSEGIRAYGTVVKLADAAADHIVSFKPDTAILIDSWGFTLRVAQRVRQRAPGIRLVKLIGPQVWATRAGRAKTLAATVDHLLCIHEFETPYYAPFGLKTTVIGNPALSRTTQGDGAAFRARYGFSDEDRILLVLPGSRSSELVRVAPVLMEAARVLHDRMPDMKVVAAPAASILGDFKTAFPDAQRWCRLIEEPAESYDVMAGSDVALACSGTVTSELAVQHIPFVLGYKTGWLTWAAARAFLYKPDYIALINIAAGREIAPEFMQTKFTVANLVEATAHLLDSKAARRAQIEAQNAVLPKMGLGRRPAAELAAEAILGG